MPDNTQTLTLTRSINRYYWPMSSNRVICIPGRLSVRVEGSTQTPLSGK